MPLNRGKSTRISSRSRSQPRFAVGRGNVGGVPFSLLAAIATNDKNKIFFSPVIEDRRPLWRNWLARSAVNRKCNEL